MTAEKERSEATTHQQARQQVERLVERMLDLLEKLTAAAIPAHRTLYHRQIEAADHEVDALVYDLYGLTEQEIRVMEDNA